jgi:hypothetical protein
MAEILKAKTHGPRETAPSRAVCQEGGRIESAPESVKPAPANTDSTKSAQS